MNVAVHRSLRKAKLSACSALLTRFPSFICALVITLVCALSVSLTHGQAVVQSSTSFGSGGSSGTTYAIAKPTGLAVGDLMVMSAAIEGGKSFTAPSATGAWTEVIRTSNGSNLFIVVLRKIAVQADVNASNFSVGVGGGKYSIGLSRITGHNPTSPIAASAGATGSGTAVAAPAITTTAANQLVLAFHGVKKSATFTASGSFGTEIYDVAADPPSHAAYRYVQASAGSTGAKTATSTQSETWVGIQVAIASRPSISTTGTPSALSTTYGTASTPTSFSVSGSNIVSGILVTPPSGFEVSTNNSTFTSTVTVNGTGTINSTTVHLRLAANATAGAKSGNITLASGATSVNLATNASTVEQKALTGSFTASTKTYDRTTTATVASRTVNGIVGSDVVNHTGGTATFADAAVGTAKIVTLTGATLTGAAASNYTLTSVSTATANITTKTLTGTFTASNKIYDGTASATVATRAVTGIVGSDDVNHTGGTATFANATVGTAKTVTLTGATLTGAAASNYTLSSVSTAAANITPLPLTITAAAASKASGEADPSLTYSSDGLLAGGSITGSLARASGETTGSYPITQGSLSAGSNYTISFTAANFVITGLKAMADSIQKPGTISALKIPVADLLANDGTLGANGEVVAAPNLTVTAAQTSLGAALAIRGQFILFLPTTNGQETLTYTVSNGTATSTATVTLTGEASAPPFSLAVIKRGTAAFSGGSTSVTHDFLGVPNQTYRIQYTTDLSTWTTAPDQSSGSTGSFSVTFTQSGDLAAAWNSQMFFRATKP